MMERGLADKIGDSISKGANPITNAEGINWGILRNLADGFIAVANVVLGFIVVALFMGLFIEIVLEIAYITIPTIRILIQNHRGGRFSRQVDKLLLDADRAINNANTLQTGKNPMALYIRYKVKAIFVLALCLWIIVTPGLLIDLVGRVIAPIIALIINIMNRT